jgi:hypothetical protein
MKESEKYVGKVYVHKTLGKVTVDNIHESSRVLVDVTSVDRGEGWDEIRQTYKGVKRTNGWFRGENKQFGHKDVVHINELQ